MFCLALALATLFCSFSSVTRKYDNYQTWYVEEKYKSIIIDPWLTNSLQPDKSFFIQRKKKIPTC